LFFTPSTEKYIEVKINLLDYIVDPEFFFDKTKKLFNNPIDNYELNSSLLVTVMMRDFVPLSDKIKFLDKCISITDISEDVSAYLLAKANVYHSYKLFKKAIKCLRESEELGEDYYTLYMVLSSLEYENNEKEKAFKTIERGLKKNSSNIELNLFKSCLYQYEGKLDSADYVLDHVVSLKISDKNNLFYMRGKMNIENKKYDLARQDFSYIRNQKDSQCYTALNNSYVSTYGFQEQYDKAIELLERFVSKCTNLPDSLYTINLAGLYMYKKEYEKSISCINMQTLYFQTKNNFNSMNVMCLLKLDRFKEAFGLYEKFFSIYYGAMSDESSYLDFFVEKLSIGLMFYLEGHTSEGLAIMDELLLPYQVKYFNFRDHVYHLKMNILKNEMEKNRVDLDIEGYINISFSYFIQKKEYKFLKRRYPNLDFSSLLKAGKD